MREYLHEEVKLPLDWIFMLIGFKRTQLIFYQIP